MNFFEKLKKELFPDPDRFLDVDSGKIFNSIPELIRARREDGRRGGKIRRLSKYEER